MSGLKAPILNILGKTYQPLSLVEHRFGRYDIAFRTDEKGNPILLFIGLKDENGKIRGERYARRLLLDKNGNIIKDHWDNKGKATAGI
ncbi:hypothetical protein [Pedobacter namyangjuensis]|uniref:hypothetical protein n=1 Tax=Pedobacter namyangjuensis TaxID=600626 RepID=UPI000DE3891D|nr:hypothetical protein [Pedobacter namyangjuensis]